MYIYIMYTYNVYNVSANLCISAIKLEKTWGKSRWYHLIDADVLSKMLIKTGTGDVAFNDFPISKKMRVFHCQVWFPGSFGGAITACLLLARGQSNSGPRKNIQEWMSAVILSF